MTSIFQYFSNIPQFFFTWSIFFSAGIAYFLIRIVRTSTIFSISNLVRHCVPFNPIKSDSFKMDVKIYVIKKLTDFIFRAPGFTLFIFLSVAILGLLKSHIPQPPLVEINPYTALIFTFIMIIFLEFGFYVFHYILHKFPSLWEFHKVHHSADILNPLTNLRSHPFEQVLKYVVVAGVMPIPVALLMFITDLNMVEILAANAITNSIITVTTLVPLRHSHIPLGFGALDWFLMSPHMHQVHHSNAKIHWDKNFGTNLSIFDWIFGTAYRPEKGERLAYGIFGMSDADHKKFNTLWGAYVSPFKRSYDALRPPPKLQQRFQPKLDDRIEQC